MAYVQGSTSAINIGTSISPNDVSNEIGDAKLVLAVCDQGANNNWTSTGSYTEIADQSGGGVGAMVQWRIATAANEASPTLTSARSDSLVAGVLTIKDVPSSAIIDGYATVNITTGQEGQYPALTTTVDNCLILYVAMMDRGTGTSWSANGMHQEILDGDAQVGLSVSHGFQHTAGAVYRPTAWATRNQYDTQLWTIAIKSDTGIAPPHGVSAAMDIIHPLSGNTNQDYGDGTFDDPTVDGLTQLDYGTYSYTLTGATTLTVANLGLNGRESGHLSLTGGVEGMFGTTVDLTSVDLSNRLVCWHYTVVEDSLVPTTQIPISVGLRSNGDSAYRTWLCGGSDAVPTPFNNLGTIVIDTADATRVMDSIGTWDATTVDGVFLSMHRDNSGGSTNNGYFYGCFALNDLVVSGGSAEKPASFVDFHKIARGSGLKTTENQTGITDEQVAVIQPCQLGDGSGNTYVKAVGQSLAFGADHDISTLKFFTHAGVGSLGLKIYGVSGDTIKIDKSVVTFGTQGYITFDPLCTSAATWGFAGTIFKKAQVSLRNIGNNALDGLLITECLELIHNGADLGGVTVDACTSAQAITITGATQAALQTAMDLLGDSIWTNDAVAIRIEYTGTGDISLNLSGITWTGNTTDIHYNSTNSSALTVVMQNGSNASTSAISGNATGVTISNDVTGTFTGLLAGSSVTVIEDMSAWSDWVISTVYAANAIVRSATDGLWYQTAAGGTSAGNDSDLAGGSDTGVAWVLYSIEDFHVESSGTSEAWSFTAPLGHSFDYYVVKAGYDPVISTGNAAFTSDSTFAIVQKAVPIYA